MMREGIPHTDATPLALPAVPLRHEVETRKGLSRVLACRGEVRVAITGWMAEPVAQAEAARFAERQADLFAHAGAKVLEGAR